jgi:hypothetical protein
MLVVHSPLMLRHLAHQSLPRQHPLSGMIEVKAILITHSPPNP